MVSITTGMIASVTKGTLKGKDDISISNVTIDSRKACKGSLFVCIKGDRTDGHLYASKAVQNGAAAILCEDDIKDLTVPVIKVASSVKAMGDIAAALLKTAAIPIVAVSGSVGKTSTKEMIASVLSKKYNVLKTEANYNNEIGLPLTVFNLEQYHEAAVLELGIDDFNQMHYLASIAVPDICVFTNIGDCHLEQLGDRNGVWRAKSEMIDHMKGTGSIVLNGDDALLREKTVINGRVPVFYGTGENCDVRAVNIHRHGADGSTFDIVLSEKVLALSGRTEKAVHVTLHQSGDHMILNALAAAAAGILLGTDTKQIADGIAGFETIDGRFKITKTGKYTVIDDCYNANPMSMKAALKSLSMMEGRKVAILGDMGELGDDSIQFHKEVGEEASRLRINALYCVGEQSIYMADAAKEASLSDSVMDIFHFPDIETLLRSLPSLLKTNDVILVKASHFMNFGRILRILISEK